MDYVVGNFIVGIFLIILGIKNTQGNITFLHKYHTKRVKEEDIVPFGKVVGTGCIIIGIMMLVSGVFSLVALLTTNSTFDIVGLVFMIGGLLVGLGFIFYGMFKYNKGIF